MNPATMPPLPPNLRGTLPHPMTPWKFSTELFNRAKDSTQDVLSQENQSPQASRPYKSVEVLPSDPEAQFILRYFEHQKPPHYGIRRIFCIHNPAHTTSFETGITNINHEFEDLAFAPKWQEEDLPQERRKVIDRWKEFTAQFSPVEIARPHSHPPRNDEFFRPKVVPMWHGSKKKICESVCRSNFTYFGKHHFFNSAYQSGESSSTDIGYFGSGIYFTNSAKYAAMYSPQGILILAWVSMREPYPVISDKPHPDNKNCTDMKKLKGKGYYQNYNAHYVPVAPINPLSPHCVEHFPCSGNQQPVCDELVVFHNSQTLPRFWIELGVDLPKPVTLLPVSLDTSNPPDKDKELFLKYQEAAIKKDPEAQFNLGMCYLDGKGVAQIAKEAVKWFQKAAHSKHPKAAFQLGLCHAKGLGVPKNESEAFKWYQKAAEQKLPEAECQIGACYFKGLGVPMNLREAVQWYQRAATQNFPLAQYYLGSALFNGRGIEKDTSRGIELHRKAAEQGIVPAQYYLGMFYLKGDGVPQDKNEALTWLKKAADLGDQDAKTQVLRLTSSSVSSPPAQHLPVTVLPPQGTIQQYQQAADQGNAEAQCKLGACYFKGTGVPKDEREAVRWYQKAADQGFPLAQYYLGSALFNGKGIEKDTARGIELHLKAAEKGVVPAMYYLGMFYLKGDGVPLSTQQALIWFQRAADLKDQDAKKQVDQILSLMVSIAVLPEADAAQAFSVAEQQVAQGNHLAAVVGYQKAAELGHAEAQCKLGSYYFKGTVFGQNLQEAVKWYQKAAEQNFPLAQYYLGSALFNGRGIERDISRGIALHLKAAEQGIVPAQYYLGTFYLEGNGVPQSKEEALKWFLMAAEKEDKDAKKYVEQILGHPIP